MSVEEIEHAVAELNAEDLKAFHEWYRDFRAVQEGLEDVRAGRVRDLDEAVAKDIRERMHARAQQLNEQA